MIDYVRDLFRYNNVSRTAYEIKCMEFVQKVFDHNSTI